MNPKLSPLFNRRSVRAYTGGQITDAQIQDIPVSAIALGCPDGIPEPRTRFNRAAVHQETW